jgi:NAD(P)-dependent dehydrogenase (short-subunit alcohol dehydrogenase family)
VAEKLGVIDASVVNADIRRHASVETFSLEKLDLIVDVTVRGVFLAIQAAVARIRDGGWLITIGSNTAIRGWHAGEQRLCLDHGGCCGHDQRGCSRSRASADRH